MNSLYFGMFFALQGTCCGFTLLFRRYVFLPFKGRVVNSLYFFRRYVFLPFKGRVVSSLYFSGGMFFGPSRDVLWIHFTFPEIICVV